MKTIARIFPAICLLSFLCLISCKESTGSNRKNINGDAVVEKHEIAIAIYNEIKVEGAIDVIYEAQPDEAAFLEVEADESIIPLVDVKVKGKTLHIKARESINPSRFTVYTNSPSLKYIESKGASKVRLNGTIEGKDIKIELKGTGDFKAENLIYEKGEFKLEGSGDMEMGGEISKAKYEISGNGNMAATDMATTELECKIKGTGNMEVNATEKMSIEIGGNGNISYKGKPQITKQKIKGAGTVKPL